ncbi:nicotinamide-nucleotide amidase [Methylohalobius crimeensis]|uniref:nicotinamide-nucleotide amidase n=1 Tax=Methylohalobius crimeensis TaxID=244365 RepID=UPI0004161562|nr:nicotinamide-nucleotide amidase [Methylohalobius crimeensis]
MEVGQCLRGKSLCLATAESCTGGWIAKCLTDVAGSSEWFERGFVTYSNQAKMEMLGVKAETLNRYGAVSEAVVAEMAAGALAHSRAQVAVAVSGIAGPGGGTPDKPVGRVWLAWQVKDRPYRTERLQLSGDRENVRRQAVARALEGVLDVCHRF